jgi:DNA-binding XRE family transcriptional regulator
MEKEKFVLARKSLGKTQKQLAELLGTSLKAIHSYEQGWRSIPVNVERQLFFLIATKGEENQTHQPCWVIRKCPPDRKERCPAWEFKAGRLCWFINGTICEGVVHKNWDEKMKICQSCEVLSSGALSFLFES